MPSALSSCLNHWLILNLESCKKIFLTHFLINVQFFVDFCSFWFLKCLSTDDWIEKMWCICTYISYIYVYIHTIGYPSSMKKSVMFMQYTLYVNTYLYALYHIYISLSNLCSIPYIYIFIQSMQYSIYVYMYICIYIHTHTYNRISFSYKNRVQSCHLQQHGWTWSTLSFMKYVRQR